MEKLIDIIQTLEKRVLSVPERKYIGQKWRMIDKKLIEKYSVDKIIANVVEGLRAELKKLPKAEEPIDVHAMMLDEIGKGHRDDEEKISSKDTVDGLLMKPLLLQRVFNPQAVQKKAYLLFDRKYRLKDTDNSTEFRWVVAPGGRGYNIDTAATTANIQDIVSLKITNFMFPITDGLDYQQKRLFIEVEDVTQSYVMADKRRFHFVMEIGAKTNMYEIDDIGNVATEFGFREPINDIDIMTVRFHTLDRVLALTADELDGTVTSVGVTTVITFSANHYCLANDYITISGFATNNSADAGIVSLVNGTRKIASVTDTTMTLNIDISGLIGVIVVPTHVYFESKRFVINMEVVYMK